MATDFSNYPNPFIINHIHNLTMKTNPLILIDGSSYLYRAFHALPSLTTSQGMPTGAVYGITNMLKSLVLDYQPIYAAVVFDTAAKTFRADLYPEYKANRATMPADLVAQITMIYEIVQALGFPLLKVEGVEADDVIGTLAKQAEAQEMDTLIFTSDKDFAQLVSPRITLIDTMKNHRLDVQGVIEKFGIAPKLIVDYLCLTGDVVDNVPGVPKVGPKTAVKWLTTYGDLTQLITQATEIKGKIGEYLRQSLPQFALTRQLLTIKCDVSLSQLPTDLQVSPPDIEKLRQLFIQLEFKPWLKELVNLTNLQNSTTVELDLQESILIYENDVKGDILNTYSATPVASPCQIILDKADFDDWLKHGHAAELLAISVQTAGEEYLTATLVGIAITMPSPVTDSALLTVYIPLAHDYLGAPTQLQHDQVLSALQPILENPRLLKIGHHLKYVAHVLANYGIQLQGMAYDTMLESYVLDSTQDHQLAALSQRYLEITGLSLGELIGTGKKPLPFAQLNLVSAAQYATQQAELIWQVHQVLWPQLQAHPNLCEIFTTLEMPLIPILVQMERHGVNLDAHLLQQQSSELAGQLHYLEQQAYQFAGTEFNLNSPKQLQTILFDQLQLPVLKKTPKKEPSTAVEVLEELALSYPLPQVILEYRSLSKLKSTYTDALPHQIQPHTQRVHTSYQQAVTVTGRLSSVAPNLQNIPIRTPAGRRIRQAFIATPGYQLLAADYSQIELRIMAHLSQDEKLLTAFANHQDIHQATAAEVFKLPLTEVTAVQRRSAKAVNFGLIYGMQAFGLAKQLGIGQTEAQNYINTYFERYAQVKLYMDTTRELARRQGYVETVFGRRLYIPDLHAKNAQQRHYAERSAINAPMQGTAADIIKQAMVKLGPWLQVNDGKIKLLMQVHDELVFEILTAQVEEATGTIRQAMIEAAQLTVPLVVEIGVGKNWEEAHG